MSKIDVNEVHAAIAIALHLFQEDNGIHDHESDVVTFNSFEERRNSPWNHKIFTLRNTPQVGGKR